MRASFAAVATVASLLALTGGAARANGAFPDSLALLLPEGRPEAIDLATNFGLLSTRDGGASWFWVCEQAIGPGTITLYQRAPIAGGQLVAVGSAGLYTSTDDGCSWATGGGSLDGRSGVVDAFVDPGDAARVVALAWVPRDGGLDSALVESRDGGRSFGAPLLVAPDGLYFSSLEIPRGAPERLYATLYAGRDLHPYLARSVDGGAHFEQLDELGAVGPATLRIAAVSPVDPLTLYVRSNGAATDTLDISHDGGATFHRALAPGDRLTAFLRRADGTLLAGTRDGRAFRSRDDGAHFEPWAIGLHLRALAERGGRLYAAADNLADPFAVGVSDDGERFQPLFHYAQTCGWRPCPAVAAACAPRWSIQAATLGITAAPGCPAADAGAAPPSTPGGCGCEVATRERTPHPVSALTAIALLLAAAIRSRPRARIRRNCREKTFPLRE